MNNTECRLSEDLEKEWKALRDAELETPEPSPEMDHTILAYAAARQASIRSRGLLFRRITALAAVFALCMGITFSVINAGKTVPQTTSHTVFEFDSLNSDICMLSEQLQDTSDTMESAAALELAAQNRME